jgi:hypothetical protein
MIAKDEYGNLKERLMIAKDEYGNLIEILDADFPSTENGSYASSEPDMVLTKDGWRSSSGLTWVETP